MAASAIDAPQSASRARNNAATGHQSVIAIWPATWQARRNATLRVTQAITARPGADGRTWPCHHAGAGIDNGAAASSWPRQQPAAGKLNMLLLACGIIDERENIMMIVGRWHYHAALSASSNILPHR